MTTAAKMLKEKISEVDGARVLDERFRIRAVKGGAGCVVTAGPEASEEDRQLAAEPGLFDSMEKAAAWLAK